jgi:hypothetical protein
MATRPAPADVQAVDPPASFVDGFARGLHVLRLDFTFALGQAAVPIQLPAGSILIWCVTQVEEDFSGGTGDCTVSIGTAPGRIDILTPDGMGAIHSVNVRTATGALPFPQDPNQSQAWLNVDCQGATRGAGTVALLYTRR